jgi:hypothetical protein
MVGRDAERLRFVSKIEALKPGTTSTRLFCPVSDDFTPFTENVTLYQDIIERDIRSRFQ